MKRALSSMLLIVSCLGQIVSVVFCIYCFVSLNCRLDELANKPGASGVDYFGIGMGYGFFLFCASVLGLILSGISTKLSKQKILRYIFDAAKGVYYEEKICETNAICRNDDELTLCLIKEL